MLPYREIPPLADMPDTYLESGHFWIQEYVIGRIIGFEMADSGLLMFGMDGVEFGAEDAPFYLRRGIETVQRDLDRDTLRAGTEDVESYTFFGVVPLWSGVDYDWDAIPPFMGVDIWDEREAGYVPEDVVERVFDSVGLESVNCFEKEVPARSFNPRTYEIPDSQWADEQAAGIVLRKKHGEPARLIADSFEDRHPSSEPLEARDALIEEWVAERVDPETIDALRSGSTPIDEADPRSVTIDILSELTRREYETLATVVEKAPERLQTVILERVREVQRTVY